MRVDSHQHFWTLARGDYGWMSPELGPIYRDFAPDDLAPLIAEAGIDKTIVVQAADTVAETEFLLDLADRTDFVAGVVGWVDMAAPDALATLERLAQNPHFKGIRPMIQEIEEDEWVLRPELDPVFAALCEMGLSFDALVLPRHLPHLLGRLGKHPDLNCVINHAAKPDLRTGDLTAWATDIGRIAADTPSYCKLSGLVTEAEAGYTTDTFRPVSDLLLSAFGPDRVMFGSDWPVMTLNANYGSWIDMADSLLADLEPGARESVWAGSASTFYRL